MDEDDELLLGLAAGLDLPTAAAMSADDGNDDGDADDGDDGGGCLTVLLCVALIGSLAGLLIA
jgi:hypothetical protein